MSDNYAPRWIIVDDTDPRIQYDGPGWFQDQGSQDDKGNFGPSYDSTLHGTRTNGSLSFAFSGLRVNVTGSNDPLINSGVVDPTWECFIDHISIGRYPFSSTPENDYKFCVTEEDLVDGPHVITVNATVKMGQTFWFDTIKYVPSPDVPLDREAILVDNVDPAMQFGDGWTEFADIANVTTVPNSNMTFSFVGTSMTWYGISPANYPLVPAMGRYSVDGGDFNTFPLKGAPNSDTTIYVVKYFETPPYPAGLHEIVVTFLGSQETTPLVLNHAVVQNGSFPSTSTSLPTIIGPTSIASGTAGPSSGTPIHHSSKTGMVVGSVVGAALVILLAIAFLYLYRSRWRIKQIDGHENTRSDIMVVERFRSIPTLPRQDATYSTFTPGTRADRVVTKLNSSTPLSSEPSYGELSSENHRSQRRKFPIPAVPQLSNSGHYIQPGGSPGGDSDTSHIPPLRVIRHEDSGVRLPEVVREAEVVEIPPVYTVI